MQSPINLLFIVFLFFCCCKDNEKSIMMHYVKENFKHPLAELIQMNGVSCANNQGILLLFE